MMLCPSMPALIRALFFDLSFVVDAYLDARAAALLRADGYAAALLAGLPQGVAVVDVIGDPVRERRQVPRRRELDALVDHPDPRAVAVLAAGPRQFRATAVRLAEAEAEMGKPTGDTGGEPNGGGRGRA